jgi:hypothetical protein
MPKRSSIIHMQTPRNSGNGFGHRREVPPGRTKAIHGMTGAAVIELFITGEDL